MDIIFFLKILSGIIVVGCSAGLVVHLHKIGLLRNTISGIRDSVKDRFDTKQKEFIRAVETGALLEEQKGFAGFIQKEGQRYTYSGLEDRFGGLSVTIYLFIKIILSVLIACIAIGGFHSVVMGLGTGIVFYILILVLETYLANKNYKAVDDCMAQFLNMLGNFGETEGRITGVMRRVSPYMTEPLRSKLEQCSAMGKLTGDETLALTILANQIEHPRFKEVIRNLINCSEYSADFGKVVEGSKRILSQERKFKRERKVMGREALINMIIVTVMLVATWFLSARLISMSVQELLFGSMLGRFCILAIIATYAIFAIKLMRENK